MTTRALVLTPPPRSAGDVLNADALAFLETLHRRFNETRLALLGRRAERQKAFDAGVLPDFLAETRAIRGGSWQVAPAPGDLQNPPLQITGPLDPTLSINP